MQFKKKYDPSSEAKWFKHKDAEFLIAPNLNPRMKMVMLELFTLEEAVGIEEKGGLALGNTIKGKEAIERLNELYAKGIVFDWKNVLDGTEPVPFSHENVLEQMNSDFEFRNWTIQCANELILERLKEKDEIVKN